MTQASRRLEKPWIAIDAVLARQEMRTADLGGKLGTRAFGEAVAKEISQ